MADLTLDSPALLEGLSEAAMILTGDRVVAANAAARSLLGDRIDGAALSEVISHPAALAALERGVEAAEGVELTGLGGSRRHWLMRSATLPGRASLIRFVDRSEARAAEQAAENARRIAAERNSSIVRSIEPRLPAIAADSGQILQLLDNLIANALRYGEAGTPVTVRAYAEGAMVHLSVSDQGEGIAPEHIARLTERFYRVDASRSRSLGGTGLGLSIVKHIVERHRGRLSIESKVGVGTRIHVLLPAAVS